MRLRHASCASLPAASRFAEDVASQGKRQTPTKVRIGIGFSGIVGRYLFACRVVVRVPHVPFLESNRRGFTHGRCRAELAGYAVLCGRAAQTRRHQRPKVVATKPLRPRRVHLRFGEQRPHLRLFWSHVAHVGKRNDLRRTRQLCRQLAVLLAHPVPAWSSGVARVHVVCHRAKLRRRDGVRRELGVSACAGPLLGDGGSSSTHFAVGDDVCDF